MIKYVQRYIRRNKRKWPFVSGDVKIVRFFHQDQPIFMGLKHKGDPVQRTHKNGSFSSLAHLDILHHFISNTGTFIDVGANVGNHAIFAAKFLNFDRVVVFEPNPEVIDLLCLNLMLNHVTDIVDCSKLGVGVSDEDAEGLSMQRQKRVIAASKLLDEGGDIKAFTGDSLLADETPDLIKIDVEGMEMRVLKGLRETIAKHQPTILIEINNDSDKEFLDWIAENDYKIVHRYRSFRDHTDNIAVHSSKTELIDKLAEADFVLLEELS